MNNITNITRHRHDHGVVYTPLQHRNTNYHRLTRLTNNNPPLLFLLLFILFHLLRLLVLPSFCSPTFILGWLYSLLAQISLLLPNTFPWLLVIFQFLFFPRMSTPQLQWSSLSLVIEFFVQKISKQRPQHGMTTFHWLVPESIFP